MEPTDAAAPSSRPAGSQRYLPRVLVWIVVLAAAARVIMLFADRGRTVDHGAGLVAWTSADSAARTAASRGKPILYEFTAAWCPPCRRLDSEGWTDPELAQRLGRDFVPARVVDREREEGSNSPVVAELQKRYGIQAFPTLVVADASGNLLAKMEGYGGRRALDEFLAGALQKAAAAR